MVGRVGVVGIEAVLPVRVHGVRDLGFAAVNQRVSLGWRFSRNNCLDAEVGKEGFDFSESFGGGVEGRLIWVVVVREGEDLLVTGEAGMVWKTFDNFYTMTC